MDAVNRYSHLAYPVLPTLFFEFHGTSATQLAEDARAVEALATDRGGTAFRWVTALEDRNRLWKARHDAFYAALALRPNGRALITDVCVPISRLADCILETQQETATSPVLSTLVGHVGDGNFHVIFVLDPDRPEELVEAQRLSGRMVERALAMGGTCTGEHGVGIGKLPFMKLEHGDALDVMRAVKGALDPRGLMNPGKVVEPL
jgi:D-lactate dehydrogenase (cytochrome)